MNLSKILKNAFLIILASLVLTACATKKSTQCQDKCRVTLIQVQIL